MAKSAPHSNSTVTTDMPVGPGIGHTGGASLVSAPADVSGHHLNLKVNTDGDLGPASSAPR